MRVRKDLPRVDSNVFWSDAGPAQLIRRPKLGFKIVRRTGGRLMTTSPGHDRASVRLIFGRVNSLLSDSTFDFLRFNISGTLLHLVHGQPQVCLGPQERRMVVGHISAILQIVGLRGAVAGLSL